MRWPMLVRTERNAARRCSSVPSAFAGIRVAPVHRLVDAGEHRAGVTRVVAHGDDVVEPLAEEVVHGLGAKSVRRRRLPPRGRGSRAGSRTVGCVPAEWTSTRSPPRWRNIASPRIDRALLPGAHDEDPDGRRAGLVVEGAVVVRRASSIGPSHGLRSSTSPEARNTMSSAMFVTRSPIRSR